MNNQSFMMPLMSPRTAQQFARMRDERRDEILRAALGVFARRGLEATRIADIAEAANMSHGLIYRYFTSKEAALVALVERAVRGGTELTERALTGEASPRDRLATTHSADARRHQDRP